MIPVRWLFVLTLVSPGALASFSLAGSWSREGEDAIELLEELYASRLEAPPDGVYHYQCKGVYLVLTEAVKERSRAHVRAAFEAMESGSGVFAADRLAPVHDFVRSKGYALHHDEGIQKPVLWPSEHRLLIDWPYYSLREKLLDGSPEGWNTNLLTIDTSGRSYAQYSASGHLLFQGRMPEMGLYQGSGGVMTDFLELRLRLRALLDQARSRVAPIAAAEGELAVELEPSFDLVLALGSPPVRPRNYTKMPGVVRVNIVPEERAVALVMEWHDVLGSLMQRDRLWWREGCAMPEMLQERYAPGTDCVEYRAHDVPSQDLSRVAREVDFRWTPQHMLPVEDHRFGVPVRYTVSPSREAPAEEELRARVDGALATREERDSVMTIPPAESSSPPVEEEGARSWLPLILGAALAGASLAISIAIGKRRA